MQDGKILYRQMVVSPCTYRLALTQNIIFILWHEIRRGGWGYLHIMSPRMFHLWEFMMLLINNDNNRLKYS